MNGKKAKHLRRLAALEFAYVHGFPYMRMSELFEPPLAAVRLPQSRRKGAVAARVWAGTASAFYQELKRKYVQANSAHRVSERLRSQSGLVWRIRDR